MKKIKTVFIWSLCALCLLAGCSNADAQITENTELSAEAQQSASASCDENDTSAENENTAATDLSGQEEMSRADSDDGTTHYYKPTGSLQTQYHIETTVPATENKSSDGENKKTGTFSLIIDCTNAVNYGIRNKSPFDKIIPENGLMYYNASVEFEEGENLLKVLKRELKKNKIVINVNGEYVRGIGGLNEFDCGTQSGWLYMTDGVLPGYSMAKCKLYNGCDVRLIYTCTPGDV